MKRAALLLFLPLTVAMQSTAHATDICPQGTYEIKIDPPVSWSYKNVSFTVVGDRASLNWNDGNTGPYDVVRVIVKGGVPSRVYDYGVDVAGDTGLVAPINASGHPAQISHYTVCKKEQWTPPTTTTTTSTTTTSTTSPTSSTGTPTTTATTTPRIGEDPTTTIQSSTTSTPTSSSGVTSSTGSVPDPSTSLPPFIPPDTLPPTGDQSADSRLWVLVAAAIAVITGIFVRRRTRAV
jgi:hypothetical protein